MLSEGRLSYEENRLRLKKRGVAKIQKRDENEIKACAMAWRCHVAWLAGERKAQKEEEENESKINEIIESEVAFGWRAANESLWRAKA